MRKILGVVAVGTLLSGCASGGLFNRNSPDEFQVTRLIFGVVGVRQEH